MDFPLNGLLDSRRCYEFLLPLLHPKDFHCPNGHPLTEAYIHKRDRDPLVDYCCKTCGRFFNAFSGTILSGTKLRPVQIVQLLRGIAQGTPTAQLARELETDRRWLLVRRHQLQALAEKARNRKPLADQTVEADELYQNAGEKRRTALGAHRSASAARQQGAWPRHVGT